MERSEQAMARTELSSPPLAWNQDGSRFVVPSTVAMWRVCRKPLRGRRLKPFNTIDGPLRLTLDADFRDLAESVNHVPGWYVLQPVDQFGSVIEDVPMACVEVVVSPQDGESSELSEPDDPMALVVRRLAETLQQSVVSSNQREQAMINAIGEITSSVYAGLAQVQHSTAALISSVQAGFDVASGVSLQKLPPPPELPPSPETPQEKSFLEFLCSPAGNTAISALGGVLKAAVGDK